MRVLVCGWVGSTNLGDELVFAGVRDLLTTVGGTATRVCAVSTAPETTRREHGVAAIDHRRTDLISRAARAADLVVFGGGGLVQDVTSPLNLPYHLSRPWLAARHGTPWVGISLGIGPLHTSLGRRLATTVLREAKAVTVRDEASAALAASLGIAGRLGADAAFHLDVPFEGATGVATAVAAGTGGLTEGSPGARPRVEVESSPHAIVVSLRPWQGGGGRLPVGWRRAIGEPDWFVPTVATQLERASRRSGMPVRFVALQTDRDHELHRRVAASMRTPTETLVPTRRSVLDELASSRVVVAMRYHAAIGATLAGRPSVLIGYSLKVDALADTLGEGAAHLTFDRDAFEHLSEAILRQLDSATAGAAVTTAADRLRARSLVDHQVLADVLRPR
jgi:polysaccharide pyruvyl transferase CsaB